MQRFNNPLDNVRIASPCKVDWEQMTGNERVKFCGQCHLNVYNLSSMSRAEAEHLLVNSEGRLCVRYYRRTDGSILTKDCPVGLRAIKRRLSYVSRAITSAVLTFLAGIGIYEATRVVESGRRPEIMGTIAVKQLPPPEIVPTGLHVMGGVPATMGKFVARKPRRR